MALTKIKSTGIADDAVTAGKIAAGAVVADITSGSVTATHLAGSIPLSKTNFTAGNGISLATDTVAVNSTLGHVTSVGTLTSLTGGTGDFNWDSGTLLVDSSANAVGIGCSPSYPLQVQGIIASSDSTGTFRLISTAGGTTTLDFKNDASVFKIRDADAGKEMYHVKSSASGYHKWYINDVEKMTLDSSGNATFAGKVTGDDSFLTSTRGELTWSGTASIGFIVKGTSGNALSLGSNNNQDTLVLDTSGNATFAGNVYIANNNAIWMRNNADDADTSAIWTGTSDELNFRTGGSGTALTINSSGNATFAGTVTGKANASNTSTTIGGDFSGCAFYTDGGDIGTGRIFLRGGGGAADDLIGINNEGSANDRLVIHNYTQAYTMAKFHYDGSLTMKLGATFGGTITTAGVARTMVIDPKLYSKDNVYGTDDTRVAMQNDQQTIPLLPGYTITSVVIPTATNRTSFSWNWELCKHDEYATETVVSSGSTGNQSGNPWITMDVTDYTIEDEQRVYFRISSVTTAGGTYGYMYNWRVAYTSPTTM
jgi:hypothetical protein